MLERSDFVNPYDLLLILAIVGAVPFFLVCRLLWHAGTWFKRHSRLEYSEKE